MVCGAQELILQHAGEELALKPWAFVPLAHHLTTLRLDCPDVDVDEQGGGSPSVRADPYVLGAGPAIAALRRLRTLVIEGVRCCW